MKFDGNRKLRRTRRSRRPFRNNRVEVEEVFTIKADKGCFVVADGASELVDKNVLMTTKGEPKAKERPAEPISDCEEKFSDNDKKWSVLEEAEKIVAAETKDEETIPEDYIEMDIQKLVRIIAYKAIANLFTIGERTIKGLMAEGADTEPHMEVKDDEDSSEGYTVTNLPEMVSVIINKTIIDLFAAGKHTVNGLMIQLLSETLSEENFKRLFPEE